MTFILRLASFMRLIKFLVTYPDTLLVGGPRVLALLGSKYITRLPGYYSQCGQDSFTSIYLFPIVNNSEFPPLFVDIGCNHPQTHNNSLFFEQFMGFKVLAIDALDKHRDFWLETRPNAEIVVAALGTDGSTIQFEEVVSEGGNEDMYSGVAGASNKFLELNRVKRSFRTVSLSRIFSERGITEVGILSIDIEGYEMDVLESIDFSSVDIRIVIIENNTSNRIGSDSIRSLLISKGYVFYARIWLMDDVFVSTASLETISRQNDAFPFLHNILNRSKQL
jgi:FkbM family methyltransferase